MPADRLQRILIIDNYDSFTWNLAHLIAGVTGEMPTVVRNDEVSWEQIEAAGYDGIVISPGPGHPGNARDFGVSAEVIRQAKVPVLGVCLGHQGIALEFGGDVVQVEPAHGLVGGVEHDGDELFAGVPARFQTVRYHSLAVAVAEPLPDELVKIAWAEDGMVMALRHATRPMWGVQFHPESILSEHGPTILGNFVRACGAGRPTAVAATPSFRERFGEERYAFWLDSSRQTERDHQSFMGVASEVISYRAATRELTITRDGRTERRTQTIFDFLDEALRENRVGGSAPFPGGYVGYFGYELRADCGSPVSHPSPFPDAMLMRVDHVVRADGAGVRLDGGAGVKPAVVTRPRLSREQYLERIEQCLTHLREGEAYELCLTNQVEFETGVSALTYYEALREVNPAPYSAYLRFGDLEIACSSPECFLRVTADGRVESRPIKGTVPRGRTAEEDELLRHMLANDPQYRAENLMITDLVRHDLGRVARAGSVEVPALMEVESYATVHQLVSTVTAKLRPGATAVDCLRAAFPGGSMTGAPKLRAMELLDGLEPGARGIYSGSIGYLGFDGSADLNIVIRSAIFERGRVSIGTGGAIVAHAEPGAEFDETQLKLAALLGAFRIS